METGSSGQAKTVKNIDKALKSEQVVYWISLSLIVTGVVLGSLVQLFQSEAKPLHLLLSSLPALAGGFLAYRMLYNQLRSHEIESAGVTKYETKVMLLIGAILLVGAAGLAATLINVDLANWGQLAANGVYIVFGSFALVDLYQWQINKRHNESITQQTDRGSLSKYGKLDEAIGGRWGYPFELEKWRELVEYRLYVIVERLDSQIKRIERLKVLYLSLGTVLAILGVISMFFLGNISPDNQFKSTTDILLFVGRFTLFIFIELVSFYYFRLYRENSSFANNYQRDISDIEYKYLALISADHWNAGNRDQLCEIMAFRASDKSLALNPRKDNHTAIGAEKDLPAILNSLGDLISKIK